MTAVDEIKARLDIVDIVSENVKLRRSGKSYSGFCPFHPNSKTPAFAVFPDSGTWRCFGQCNEGGDIFKYVMKREGWDFPEALRHLAERAGVMLEPMTPERKETEDRFEQLRTSLEEAVQFYQFQLLKTPAGKPALDYLLGRGINQDSISKFELGYAPNSYESIINHLNGKGYALEDLQEAGLANARDSGGYYDKFRNRIMFPIRDGAGKMAGFGARILDPEDIPKFLNSPQTVLFDKGHLLYGLNLARKPIRTLDQVVIVEGYLDVIALHQCGFENTVSPMGTALNEDQLRFLKKFTRRIVLALDADAAGEKATMRGLETARQALDRESEAVFDARGLLRHEARLQADVRVTTLPEGLDPDDVVLNDPEMWKKILEHAKPIVMHVMETLASGQNLDDAKVKTAIAAQVLPLIEDLPSAIERDTYRQQLARLLKIDERSLVGVQRVHERTRKRQKPDANADIQKEHVIVPKLDKRAQQMETHSLTLLIHRPDCFYDLDRALKESGLEKFTPEDFDDSENQILARILQSGLNQDEQEPIEFMRSQLEGSILERFNQVSTSKAITEKNEEKLLDDLVRTLISLRLMRVNLVLNQLRFMHADEEINEDDRKEILSLILQNTIKRGRLDMALAKPLSKR